MDKLKLNANNLDYTKIERPVEPAFENEDPEGWCEVLVWEEARADKLEKENSELRESNKLLQELCDSRGRIIDEIAMGRNFDDHSIGYSVSQATGMTNPESIKNLELPNK